MEINCNMIRKAENSDIYFGIIRKVTQIETYFGSSKPIYNWMRDPQLKCDKIQVFKYEIL